MIIFASMDSRNWDTSALLITLSHSHLVLSPTESTSRGLPLYAIIYPGIYLLYLFHKFVNKKFAQALPGLTDNCMKKLNAAARFVGQVHFSNFTRKVFYIASQVYRSSLFLDIQFGQDYLTSNSIDKAYKQASFKLNLREFALSYPVFI